MEPKGYRKLVRDHAFAHSPIGMALIAPDGRWVKTNASLCSMTGYTEQELIHEYKLLNHADDPELESFLVRSLLEGRNQHFETEKRINHKNGRTVWIHLIVSAIRDKKGELLYFHHQFVDITKRKNTEFELSQETEQFNALMKNHPDLVLRLSLDGKVLGINDACEKITGFKKSEFMRINADFTFEGVERVKEHFRLASQGKPQEFEVFFTHKEGYKILFRTMYVPIAAAGEITGIYAIARDITDYRKTQRALNEKQSHYQSIFEHHPDGVAHMDGDGRFLAVNPIMEKLTGYDQKELRSMSLFDITFTADIKSSMTHLQHALNGISGTSEKRIRHKQGQLIDCRFTCVPIIIQNDSVGAYGIFEDITELNLTMEKLKYHENLYELISNSAQDLISYATPDGIIRYVSPSIQTLLGYAPEEYIGKSTFDFWHPEDLKAIRISDFFQESDSDLFTCRFRHKQGDYIWFESTLRAIRDEQGEFVKIFAISRDISERKQMEELMLQSEKLSIAGQLAAGIAHEIRNPLTAIKGFQKLLERQVQGKSDYFQIIDSEMDRIELIVNELLFLAKPQAVEFLAKDIQQILRQVVILMESEALLKNIQFQLRLDVGEQLVCCDENQLKQVFINFIKNAMESMEDGGIVRIDISRKNADQVNIKIADQGCGISENILARLGEPFYTTKDKGTGLGFMVSKKIITDHKGDLSVQSKVDVGTTVQIAFPLADVDEQHVNQVK